MPTAGPSSRGFDAFVDQMLGEGDYIAELGLDAVRRHLAGSYYYAALSTKHPGFAEEREWRVVFNPTLDAADHLVRSVEVCRNEPQVIYRLPLRNAPEAGIDGMALPDILEALIIGPSEARMPRAMPSSSFCRTLKSPTRSGACGCPTSRCAEVPGACGAKSPPPMLPRKRSGRRGSGRGLRQRPDLRYAAAGRERRRRHGEGSADREGVSRSSMPSSGS